MKPIYLGAPSFVARIGCQMEDLDKLLFSNAIGANQKRIIDFNVREYLTDREVPLYEQTAQYLCASTKMTLHQVNGLQVESDKFGIAFGNAFGCISIYHKLVHTVHEKGIIRGVKVRDGLNSILCGGGSKVGIQFNAESVNVINADGDVASYDAIICAADLLEDGYAEVMLVGGVEDFDDMLKRYYQTEGREFSEGAGTVLMSTNKEMVKAECMLSGKGKRFCPDGNFAEALLNSINQALMSAKLKVDEIDMIVCGMEDNNAVLYKEVMQRLFRDCAKKVWYYSSKRDFGVVAGANGIFSIVTAMRVLDKQCIPEKSKSINGEEWNRSEKADLKNVLLFDFDESGICTSLILSKI